MEAYSEHQGIVSILCTLCHCGTDLDGVSTHQLVRCVVGQRLKRRKFLEGMGLPDTACLSTV